MAADQTKALELKYAAVMILIVIAVVGLFRMGRDEVSLCREVFRGLVEGKASVQRHIDWDHLQAMGVDVAATYGSMTTAQARAKYRRLFIEHFSKGFRSTDGELKGFVNWRIEANTPQQIVVAADYKGREKTLLFSLPASGTKKITGIQWAQ